MLINQVCKMSGLTKKAIEYYTAQGLVNPQVLENGYRDYMVEDVKKLEKIHVLRMLGIGVDSIKTLLHHDEKGGLARMSVEKAIECKVNSEKNRLLEQLSRGAPYDTVKAELIALESNKTIMAKLLDCFPGQYGSFIAVHFSRFLCHLIETQSQQQAFEKIIDFLDNMPPLDIPSDVAEYLQQATAHIGIGEMLQIMESQKQAIENIEEFMKSNEAELQWYLQYKQSEEYKNSLNYRLSETIKEFNSTRGYYEVFIPAMIELSPSYEQYYNNIQIANEKFIEKYTL